MPDDTTAPVTTGADSPEWPEWADRFFEALSIALSCKGSGAQHQAEDELIEAAGLIVRARLGYAGVKNPLDLARWRIDKALKAVEAEENVR